MLAAFVMPHPPIIRPEIGRGEEAKIERTAQACREVARRVAALAPDTVIVSSPHAPAYADWFQLSPGSGALGSLRAYGAPQVGLEVEYDEQLARAVAFEARRLGLRAGQQGERETALDHATLLPLLFLREACPAFRVLRVGLSGLPPLSHYRLGQHIAQAADALGRRAVWIASADLSHKLRADGPYGYAPEGPLFDREIARALAEGDFLSILTVDAALAEAAGECGLRSLQMMAGAFDRRRVRSELLSYEGPFGVGYAVAAVTDAGADETRDLGARYDEAVREAASARRLTEDAFVRLARASAEAFVRFGRRIDLPDDLPEALTRRRAGAFVSLKKHGRLRGCIGTLAPVRDSLAEEIVHNAVSAAAQDPRFDPVTEDELAEITYSVDVLGEAEAARGPEDLDPKRYGVIVDRNGKRGVLLPDLPGVDTPEEQIAIARRKAGLGEREPARLFRFEAVRHE